MRVCKYCNVSINDNEIHCPLCGAHTSIVDATPIMPSGEYPSNAQKTPARLVVSKIFGGISVILIMAMLIASGLSHNWALFFVTITAVSYVWLGILQYIFIPRPATKIIGGIFFYIVFYLNLCFLHFYATGNNGLNGTINVLNISTGIISPILLSILNVIYLMIMFISKKWYRVSFRLFRLSIIEIAWIVLVRLLNFNIVASIVCASLDAISLVVMWIFKKDDLLVELKKHYHI